MLETLNIKRAKLVKYSVQNNFFKLELQKVCGRMVNGKNSSGYCVKREILDEEKLEKLARRLDPSQTHIPFSLRLKNSLR